MFLLLIKCLQTWQNWRGGTASNIVDPTITDGSRNEIMRCIHIALLCVQENVADRPTMASVVLMLNSYSVTLPLPSLPAFFIDSRSFPGSRSIRWIKCSICPRINKRGFHYWAISSLEFTEKSVTFRLIVTNFWFLISLFNCTQYP